MEVSYFLKFERFTAYISAGDWMCEQITLFLLHFRSQIFVSAHFLSVKCGDKRKYLRVTWAVYFCYKRNKNMSVATGNRTFAYISNRNQFRLTRWAVKAVVVVVLRFGLYRVYRLRRSKESNSRPNQVKLGNSLIIVVNLELGNVLPLRDSWVWFGLEQGNVLPLSDYWVDLVWNKVTSLPLGYSWVFVWFRYHFPRELVF